MFFSYSNSLYEHYNGSLWPISSGPLRPILPQWQFYQPKPSGITVGWFGRIQAILKEEIIKPHYFLNNSCYAATYSPTTTFIHDRQTSRPLSQAFWSSHSFGVLDLPAVPTNITLTSQVPIDFEANDDDQQSYPDWKGHLLSPLNSFQLQKESEDEDLENFYSLSPRWQSIYHSLEQYSLHNSLSSSLESWQAVPYFCSLSWQWQFSPAVIFSTQSSPTPFHLTFRVRSSVHQKNIHLQFTTATK